MNYHNITTDDMLNGDGLRVVLWVSGCQHKCVGCHNPQTWDFNSGVPFDDKAKDEIFEQLNKDYISGITFSGGDPLHENNLEDVFKLIFNIRQTYGLDKTIWLYSGYCWDDIFPTNFYGVVGIPFIQRRMILELCDVFVDGRFEQELLDNKCHWVGSSNQRVIDVQQSLKQDKIITIDR